MKRRRGLLVVGSILSLTVLLYAAIITAFSVPVTAQMEVANRLPGAAEPLAGSRALVIPPADPTRIPTFAAGEPGWGDWNGSLLVAGSTPSGFPSGTQGPQLGRALAYVAPTANGTYVPGTRTFEGLPVVEGGELVLRNITVDVTSLAQGRAGFLVKGDAEATVRFVATSELVGTLARFETPATVFLLFLAGGVGFVAPLLGLLLTHKRTGVAGLPGGALMCPECGAPQTADASFCMRCGAWLTGGRS